METSPSTRSSSRARIRNERGFVLVAALVIAVLYLGLIELLLIDGMRSLQEAQRLRSRVCAGVLAENAAELSAEKMVTGSGITITENGEDGDMSGEYARTGDAFVLTGEGSTVGVAPESAHVRLQGRIVGTSIKIDYAMHSR